MQSINKRAPTKSERAHIERIKALPCVICDAPGPSECHEIEQGLWFGSIPLCADCHRGSHNGLHGSRAMWRITGMDETKALAATVERLMAEAFAYVAIEPRR